MDSEEITTRSTLFLSRIYSTVYFYSSAISPQLWQQKSTLRSQQRWQHRPVRKQSRTFYHPQSAHNTAAKQGSRKRWKSKHPRSWRKRSEWPSYQFDASPACNSLYPLQKGRVSTCTSHWRTLFAVCKPQNQWSYVGSTTRTSSRHGKQPESNKYFNVSKL